MTAKSTLEIVWQESIETIRTQLRMTSQIVTFFIIADVTTIGYSIAENYAGLILIGSVFPMTIILFLNDIRKLLIPVVYTALNLESEMEITPKLRLGGNYAKFINNLSEGVYNEILNSTSISDVKDIKKHIGKSLTGMLSYFATTVSYFILMAHIAAPFLLYYYANWRLY